MSFIDDDSYLSQDIAEVNPAVAAILRAEVERQGETLEMIASENFTSHAVLQAVGSVLTDKYAEGLPGRRYYGGCEVVDQAEQLAIDRAKEVFGAAHVNVQSHSGATANEAAYASVLQPGDHVVAMALAHGGHLSHGLKVNFSGRLYDFHHYGVRRGDCRIDMDQVRDMARELRPALIVAGASAYPRIIDFPAFREIADEVGALFMVNMAHIAGLVAADQHPSPVGVADLGDHHHPQDPRRAAGRHGDVERGAGHQGQPGRLPRPPGRAAHARDRRQGRRAGPRPHAGVRARQEQTVLNCRALAEELLAGGVNLVSGGTDNHLVLVNLSATPLTGAEGEERLERAGITVNKNGIPFDERPPTVTSGLRIGTPALTTRGLREDDMREIARIIAAALDPGAGEADIEGLRARSRAIGDRFPLYPRLQAATPVS